MKRKAANPSLVLLMVDDDHNDLALFAVAVEKTGLPIWVQNAMGFEQAVHYLEGRGQFANRQLHPLPDMVLLDLKMNLVDGFEFLEWRRKTPAFSKLPVIIFSGSKYEAEIKRALELGAAAHLTKPHSFDELKSTVRQIWTRAGQVGQEGL